MHKPLASPVPKGKTLTSLCLLTTLSLLNTLGYWHAHEGRTLVNVNNPILSHHACYSVSYFPAVINRIFILLSLPLLNFASLIIEFLTFSAGSSYKVYHGPSGLNSIIWHYNFLS